jgi:transposase
MGGRRDSKNFSIQRPLRQIAQKYFPNALIVAVRFHVIRLINHHLLKSWQSMDPGGAA